MLHIFSFQLRAFQNFFIQIILPFSVKRGEIPVLIIIVFNYYDEEIEVSMIKETCTRTENNQCFSVDGINDFLLQG